MNLGIQVKKFPHDIEVIVIAGNNANRNLIVLQQGCHVLVCARFRIFGKVARQDQQVKILHRIRIQSFTEIRTNVDSLNELFPITDMNIGYLTYFKDLG